MDNSCNPLIFNVQYTTEVSEHTCEVPTNEVIDSEFGIYRFLISNQNARWRIYHATFHVRAEYNATAYLRHPLLRMPIIVWPSTTDAEFRRYLAAQMVIQALYQNGETLELSSLDTL
jgi:hypothetical protein